MSTINSYFNTRKSRSNNSNKDAKLIAKKGGTLTKQFAAQAPQPLYEQVIKPTIVQQQQKKKLQQQETIKRNSILHYLSPVKKNESVTTTTTETPVVEDASNIPCRIRSNIPVSSLWKDILEEFDPESHTNQLVQDSPSPFNEEEIVIEEMEVSNCTSNTTRRRKLDDDNNGTRNVRIRTSLQPLLNQTMSLEDYLLEDIQEDLARPLRTKYTLNQTSTFLLQIVDEILILSDNRWFQSTCLPTTTYINAK